MYSSLPFSYHRSLAVFRIPSLFAHLRFSRSRRFSVSLLHVYARMYIFPSFSRWLALARRLTTYPALRPPSYSPLPSTRPRSAPEQPSIRRWCVQQDEAPGEDGSCFRQRDATGYGEMRTYTELAALARSFLPSFVRSFAHSLVRSAPPCPFVPLYRLSWSSVHASRCTPRTRPSSVIWTLRRVIRNCMSST